jgi:hypothetical protein
MLVSQCCGNVEAVSRLVQPQQPEKISLWRIWLSDVRWQSGPGFETMSASLFRFILLNFFGSTHLAFARTGIFEPRNNLLD